MTGGVEVVEFMLQVSHWRCFMVYQIPFLKLMFRKIIIQQSGVWQSFFKEQTVLEYLSIHCGFSDKRLVMVKCSSHLCHP